MRCFVHVRKTHFLIIWSDQKQQLRSAVVEINLNSCIHHGWVKMFHTNSDEKMLFIFLQNLKKLDMNQQNDLTSAAEFKDKTWLFWLIL